MKRRWKLVILAVLGIALLRLYRSSPVTAEAILGWQPDDLFLAAAVLMLLYAVKSMLVFVPILIPQILAGHLYPREVALGLNLLGLVIVMTVPYLIVDDSMISVLCLAARSGVDVRIITPHKWDKRMVHITTRSYYRELIQSGVKIYEYTAGFNHAKTFVSDDVVATVGTTNLDFRSLYHHFECGTVIYGSLAVLELKADFQETLNICHRITEEDCHSGVLMRVLQDVLRLFAPLM